MSYIEAIKGKIQAIRQGKYSEGDIKLVCEIIFLGQLEWNEYPSQDKIEDVIDAVEKQREELREEFDADLIRKLNAKIKAGDVNAMVLLGQYYYDCPKDQQIEDLLVKEYVDKEFMGGAGCEDEVSRKRIDTIQQKASGLFYSAYEAGSILVLYYLIKLWENNTIDTPTPSDLKLYFEKKWKSGELSQTGFDIKALLTIKSAIYVAVERQDKIKLEKMNIMISIRMTDEAHEEIKSDIEQKLFVNLPFTELDINAHSADKRNPGRFVHDFFLECIKIFKYDKEKKFNHGEKLPRHSVWSRAFTTALHENDRGKLPPPGPPPKPVFFLDV